MSYLESLLSNRGIEYNSSFLDRVESYIEILFKWGKTHSLTNIKNLKSAYEYVYDSIFICSFLDSFAQDSKITILDIGSGAGFPGFVLALYFQDAEVTLVEPNSKKCSFLTFAKLECAAQNIKIQRCRIQDLKSNRFDLITSRALMSSQKLLELTKEFVKKESEIVFYKGCGLESEVCECNILNYRIFKNERLQYLYLKGSYVI